MGHHHSKPSQPSQPSQQELQDKLKQIALVQEKQREQQMQQEQELEREREQKQEMVKKHNLEESADKHIQNLRSVHDNLINDITEQKHIQHDNEIALKNMRKLLDKLYTSNQKMISNLDRQESTLETSRRKVWYTNQSLDKYRYYSNIITTILRIMLCMAIIFFLYDRKYGSLTIVIITYLLIMHFL